MKLQMEHLTMTYPTGKKALQDMSLTLSSPQMIGLLGPNGAGKSTLMKLLTAALLPTQGSIFVDARPLAKSEGALKAQLGYLPQDFGLYEELTVTQFLDYMAKGHSCPQSRDSAGFVGHQFDAAAASQDSYPFRRATPAGGDCAGAAGFPSALDFG